MRLAVARQLEGGVRLDLGLVQGAGKHERFSQSAAKQRFVDGVTRFEG